jgi:CHAT domain-containing protein
MQIARSLARLYMEAGAWREAGAAHATAREAFLLLFGEGLEEVEARALIVEAGPLFTEAAFAAAQRGEPQLALAYASEGRARSMAVAMKLQALELGADDRRRLTELRAAVRGAQQALETAQGRARVAALERLVGARQELLALVKGGVRADGAVDDALAEARAVAATGGALALPIVTDFGGKIVLAAPGMESRGLAVIDVPELTTQKLAAMLAGSDEPKKPGWVAAYFINYLQGPERFQRRPEWLAAINALGPELGQLFGARLAAALKERGLQPGARLVWVPSGWLGIWPLGLVQDAGGRRLGDDYEIVYVPNLQVLASTRRQLAAPAAQPSLAVVINPTGDLPGAEREGALVGSHFAAGARVALARQAATPQAVLAALPGRTHWHFASHGTFAWQEARESGLVMAGHARLSVGRLLEADGLGRPRLVVLSACETGLAQITGTPDEFIGLPGTFMALGAAGVLGTLWPVSDAATALLIARFYELHMGEGLSPPTALARAQAWLRTASGDDLSAYAGRAAEQGRLAAGQLAEMRRELSPEGIARARGGAPSGAAPDKLSDAPYAHPYFWAGFIHTGL